VTRWVNPVAAAGFSSAADVYERARPSYPAAAVAWLAERAKIGPGRTVIDLGAGTGKLTRLLVPLGARIVAVEPLAEMRAKLEEVLPAVESLDGTAEDIPLPDGAADVVTCAQAFHWFNFELAFPELHRVLADDGLLVLVWNHLRELDDELQGAIEGVLAPHRTAEPGRPDDLWRPRLTASKLFGAVEQKSFVFEQQLSRADIVDRVASTSFVAALPPADREVLLGQVGKVVAGYAEPIGFPYRTDVFVSPRAGARRGDVGGSPNEA
jgi:SAM-dependent methyltransferase